MATDLIKPSNASIVGEPPPPINVELIHQAAAVTAGYKVNLKSAIKDSKMLIVSHALYGFNEGQVTSLHVIGTNNGICSHMLRAPESSTYLGYYYRSDGTFGISVLLVGSTWAGVASYLQVYRVL